MAVAGRGQPLARQFVLVGGHVGVGRENRAVVEPALHRRARLDGQAVEADVGDDRLGRSQGQDGVERLRPVGHALPRQAVDEVEVEVVEAGRARHCHRVDRGREVVLAAE